MKIDLVKALAIVRKALDDKAFIPYFMGQSGIGKTTMFEGLAKEKGWDFVPYNCAHADFADWGLYVTEGNTVISRVPEHMKWLFNVDRPTLVLVDELPLAPEIIQGGFMCLFNERHVRGTGVSDHVRFAAAGNRAEDKVGGNPLKWPLVSRMAVFEVTTGDDYLQSWVKYMEAKGINPSHLAALAKHPTMLTNAKPSTTGRKDGGDPRSWDRALSVIHNCGLDRDESKAVLEAYVGSENASMFEGVFELPDVDAALAAPHAATIPPDDRPDLIAAFGSSIAFKATEQNLQSCLDLVLRFPTEFQNKILKDIGLRHPNLTSRPEYVQIALARI